MLPRRLFVAALPATAFASPAAATPAPSSRHLHATRSTNTLHLLDGDMVVRSFRAAFGREHGPKRIRDDARTPVGDYMVFPARASARWKWFHPIDYPNARDVAEGAARGLRKGQLGDEIGIHAHGGWPPTDLLAAHGIGWNWTAGCISVSNEEIEVVRAFVDRPMPIRLDA